ncbi:hypothetical protein B0H19DRAFT_1097265 [Mycena capillaripes]|nr:hypothetical protein B0H19DRAFT_1097265 [Mycena capillaripes]
MSPWESVRDPSASTSKTECARSVGVAGSSEMSMSISMTGRSSSTCVAAAAVVATAMVLGGTVASVTVVLPSWMSGREVWDWGQTGRRSARAVAEEEVLVAVGLVLDILGAWLAGLNSAFAR